MYVSLLDPQWNNRRQPLLLWSLITYKLIASIISLNIQLRLVRSYLQGDGKKNRRTVNWESLWLLCLVLFKGILCYVWFAQFHPWFHSSGKWMYSYPLQDPVLTHAYQPVLTQRPKSVLARMPGVCSTFPVTLLKSQSFHVSSQQELMAQLWL